MARSGRRPATEARTLVTTIVGGGEGSTATSWTARTRRCRPDRVGRADDDEVVGTPRAR